MTYGLFTGNAVSLFVPIRCMKIFILIVKLLNVSVLLKKFAGEEGERVDVQKLFGYIGLFTLVALWWLGKLLLSQ